MAVLIVTDNYFYMQGLVSMADDECNITGSITLTMSMRTSGAGTERR